MSAISVSLVICIVLAVLGISLSIILYKQRLDKVVRGELHDTHSSIPEPRETVGAAYRVILMTAVVLSLFSLGSLHTMVNNYQHSLNQLQAQHSYLQTELENLQAALRDRDRRLLLQTYEHVSADYPNRTAQVRYSAALKEYSDGTVAKLFLNGKEYPLQSCGGGRFEGVLTLELFGCYDRAYLHITENDRTYSEPAELPSDLVWQYFPLPQLDCSLSAETSHGTLRYSGSFRIITDLPEEIASASLTYLSGGRELKTMDITGEIKEGRTLTLEQGLSSEQDLTVRIAIRTRDGYTIETQSVMICMEEYPYKDFIRILSPEGTSLWSLSEKE